MGFNMGAIWQLVVAVVQLVLGMILAVAAIYMGIRFVDRMTENIEELEEIKKGNLSVGIFIFAVIIMFATVIKSGVEGIMSATSIGEGTLIGAVMAILGGIVQIIVSIIIAVLVIYLAIMIIDKMSKQIDKIKVKGLPDVKFDWNEELKKDNRAMALFIAAVLIGLGFVIQAGVQGIGSALAGIYTP